MSRLTARNKWKVATFIPLILLFIQLQLYCCTYSVQHDYTSPRRVLQCAAAAAAQKSSSSWLKEIRDWARVYEGATRRIFLALRHRLSIMFQREHLQFLDAHFYRRALELSSSGDHRHHQRPRQLRPPQRRLAPADPPRRSFTNFGQEVSFEDSMQQPATKQRAGLTGEQLALRKAEVQKQNVEEQKRFVPAGPNPLHNRR